jgi:DNA replication protein DnaC
MSDTTAIVKKAGEVFKNGFIEYSEINIECPTHGIFRGKPYSLSLAHGHKGNVNYPECPKCVEEREAKEAIETAEREREMARQRYEKWMKQMNIGKRYWDTRFDIFDDYTDELKRYLITAVNFARNPEGKLVMLGENGSGKTHLAVSILKITGGVIYTAYEIGILLKKSYDGENREWEVLEELCETKLLVIDEIGRTKGSDWELNWLSHIINKRHENMKPLILISNRHLNYDCPEGSEGCPHCMEKYFDNDVISRIIEDGLIMKFTVDDYRKRKGQEYREQKKIEATQGNRNE